MKEEETAAFISVSQRAAILGAWIDRLILAQLVAYLESRGGSAPTDETHHAVADALGRDPWFGVDTFMVTAIAFSAVADGVLVYEVQQHQPGGAPVRDSYALASGVPGSGWGLSEYLHPPADPADLTVAFQKDPFATPYDADSDDPGWPYWAGRITSKVHLGPR